MNISANKLSEKFNQNTTPYDAYLTHHPAWVIGEECDQLLVDIFFDKISMSEFHDMIHDAFIVDHDNYYVNANVECIRCTNDYSNCPKDEDDIRFDRHSERYANFRYGGYDRLLFHIGLIYYWNKRLCDYNMAKYYLTKCAGFRVGVDRHPRIFTEAEYRLAIIEQDHFKNYNEAIRLFENGCHCGYVPSMIGLSYLYFGFNNRYHYKNIVNHVKGAEYAIMAISHGGDHGYGISLLQNNMYVVSDIERQKIYEIIDKFYNDKKLTQEQYKLFKKSFGRRRF